MERSRTTMLYGNQNGAIQYMYLQSRRETLKQPLPPALHSTCPTAKLPSAGRYCLDEYRNNYWNKGFLAAYLILFRSATNSRMFRKGNPHTGRTQTALQC